MQDTSNVTVFLLHHSRTVTLLESKTARLFCTTTTTTKKGWGGGKKLDPIIYYIAILFIKSDYLFLIVLLRIKTIG